MLADRYQVLGPIGKGGMGHVYEGRCRRTNARVAIKVMHADRPSADPTVTKRFSREAQMLGSLHHSNIVRCVDHGVGETGLAYLVMEYASGRTVKQMLRQLGSLDELFALEIALQVCAGLEQAHDQGILHRDVKAANVIVGTAGNQPLVKIVDFGVGKRLSSASETNLTKPGHFVGSYKHCSPEQLTGKALDGRSDIYSLGILLFEMLTGSPPFISKSLEQLFVERIHTLIPHFRQLAPEIRVSARTEEAVRRCLAQHPDERWQSVTALQVELEECLHDARFVPATDRDTAALDETETTATTLTATTTPFVSTEPTTPEGPASHRPTMVETPERHSSTLIEYRIDDVVTRRAHPLPTPPPSPQIALRAPAATWDDEVVPTVGNEPVFPARAAHLPAPPSERAHQHRKSYRLRVGVIAVALALAAAAFAMVAVWLLLRSM